MPKTANTLINDAITRHQVYLVRLAGMIRNGMNAELDKTITDLRALLLAQDQLTSLRIASKQFNDQINSLVNKIAKIRDPGYQAAQKYATEQFAQLIENEVEFTQKAINSGVGFDVPLNVPPQTMLANILAYGVYDGASVQQWFSGWSEGDIRRIESAVRGGLAQGQTLDQMTRAIVGTKAAGYTDGIVNQTRNSAEALVRTLTNGITNSARADIYERNSDIITGVMFNAVLDGRTSEICAGLSGTVYPNVKDAPMPPLHRACRSALTPIIDGFGIVGERPTVGGTNFNTAAREDYISKQVDKGLTKKDASAKWANLSNSTKNKLRNEQIRAWDTKVIGNVTVSMSYNDWLKTQPKSFQDDVLGKTKAEIWRSGGKDKDGKPITISSFVDYNTNKPYTLEQLRVKEPQLFKEDKK